MFVGRYAVAILTLALAGSLVVTFVPAGARPGMPRLLSLLARRLIIIIANFPCQPFRSDPVAEFLTPPHGEGCLWLNPVVSGTHTIPGLYQWDDVVHGNSYPPFHDPGTRVQFTWRLEFHPLLQALAGKGEAP